jgi:hypothetical protein
MDIELIQPEVNPDKCKKPPKYRVNMYRHITKRKGKKGPHLGLVQALRKRAT